MKKLGLSSYNLDDFRFGVADLVRRGFDLSKLPTYKRLRKTTIAAMIPLGLVSSETGASVPIVSALHHTGRRFLLRPDIKKNVRDGDVITHLAKIGSDFATGHGKRNMKKSSEFNEDGSHNTGFQTLLLSTRGKQIFKNQNPGGSELLRLTTKTMEKDSQESMVANMQTLDKICSERHEQVGGIPGL